MLTKEEAHKLAKKIHEETYKIEVQVLEGGKLPFKKNQTDAGFDLIATEDIVLYPGDVQKHPLNIRLKLPRGSWGRIETKSGLGSKGMLVYAGVIDEEYRGVPHVIMTNLNSRFEEYNEKTEELPNGDCLYTRKIRRSSHEPIIIKKGEKVAQMTMNPHSTEFYIVEVDEVDTDTSRGEGGFGSTGK